MSHKKTNRVIHQALSTFEIADNNAMPDSIRKTNLEMLSKSKDFHPCFYKLSGSEKLLDKNLEKQIKILESYLSIKNDLTFILESLDFLLLSEPNKTPISVLRSMYVSIIVTYGKCFNSSDGNTTLNKKTIFKGNNEQLETHNHLIDIRNNYVAHSAKNFLSTTEVYYCLPKGESKGVKSIESIYSYSASVDDNNLSEYKAAITYVYEKVGRMVVNHENLISKKAQELPEATLDKLWFQENA